MSKGKEDQQQSDRDDSSQNRPSQSPREPDPRLIQTIRKRERENKKK